MKSWEPASDFHVVTNRDKKRYHHRYVNPASGGAVALGYYSKEKSMSQTFTCRQCGGIKVNKSARCKSPCPQSEAEFKSATQVTSQSHGPIVPVPTPPKLQIDENRLFPNRPELANPYSGVYDRLSAIREECSVMLAKKKEYDIWESIRKPILDKERDVLTNLLQSLGEIVDDQRKMREQHPELQAIIPKPKKAEKPKEDTESQPREKRAYAKRRSHHKPHAKEGYADDGVVLRVAAYIEQKQKVGSGELYKYLVREGFISPIKGARPALAFAHRLVATQQELFYFDAHKKVWLLTQPHKHTNGVVVPSNVIPHANGHANGFARAKPSKEDHAKALFVMAVNSVFKMQDNQPMGLRQIWKVVESDLADHVKQLVGAQDFDGFKVMMGQCIGDFGAMEGGLFYPVHPDNTQTVVTKQGRMVTL